MVLQNTERLIQSLRGGKAEQVLTDLHTAVTQALDIAHNSSAHQPLISPVLELQAAAQQLRRDGDSKEQITSCLEELLTEVKDLYAWKTGMLFLTEYSGHFETFLCVVVKELPVELRTGGWPNLALELLSEQLALDVAAEDGEAAPDTPVHTALQAVLQAINITWEE
jgi:hypothetical protein